MRKKLKLKLSDIRNITNGRHQKKPYFLFIEFGSNKFYFSNKKTATRWLTKFENESNNIFQELIFKFEFILKLHTKMLLNINYSEIEKNISSILWSMKRLNRIYNTNEEIVIGRELNSIYYEVDYQLKYFKEILQTNNRNYNLLIETNTQIRDVQRIRTDIDLLFSSIENLSSIESKNNLNSNYRLAIA